MMKPEAKNITLLDIKNAMKDPEFVSKLPSSLAPEIEKVKSNPTCGCNVKVYEKILNEAKDIVQGYFPNKNTSVQAVQEEVAKQPGPTPPQIRNNWKVINCSIHDLESHLAQIGAGHKQLTISRYEDQVTAVVNSPEFVPQ